MGPTNIFISGSSKPGGRLNLSGNCSCRDMRFIQQRWQSTAKSNGTVRYPSTLPNSAATPENFLEGRQSLPRRGGYRPLSDATERVSPAIAIQSANHMLARPHENLSCFRCFRHSSDRIADVRWHGNLKRNRHCAQSTAIRGRGRVRLLVRRYESAARL